MRELKFRVWVKIANFDDGLTVYPNNDSDYCMICNGDGFGIVYQNTDWLERKNFKVMQYTGIKDKNGKEIYEGDICKIDSYWPTHEIIWDFDRWVARDRNLPNTSRWDLRIHHKMEVIGNIYENEDLLNA